MGTAAIEAVVRACELRSPSSARGLFARTEAELFALIRSPKRNHAAESAQRPTELARRAGLVEMAAMPPICRALSQAMVRVKHDSSQFSPTVPMARRQLAVNRAESRAHGRDAPDFLRVGHSEPSCCPWARSLDPRASRLDRADRAESARSFLSTPTMRPRTVRGRRRVTEPATVRLPIDNSAP
jgi:hypothetical protein